MNHPTEWTEADLLDLIKTEASEGTTREYKRGDALRFGGGKAKEKVIFAVSKHVSAMANAAGGVIIYGIIEDNHLPKSLDDGFDPKTTSREWLDQIIATSIKPPPDGVIVRPVPLTGARQGKVAYVVRVPKSPRGWQANDGRYYRRRNFTTYFMEDHEVHELMNRSTHPDVAFGIGTSGERTPKGREFRLVARLGNSGPVCITSWKVVIDLPRHFVVERRAALDEFLTDEIDEGGNYVCRFTIKSEEPFFPREKIDLFGFQGGLLSGRLREVILRASDELTAEALKDSSLAVRWVVYADNMEPKEGAIPLHRLLRLREEQRASIPIEDVTDALT